MKSLLKHSSVITLTCVLLLSLVACSSAPDFDVTLENADEIIVETDDIQISRQDLFETVATGDFNPALFETLAWADYLILSELFEIDEDDIQEQIDEFFSDMDENEIEEFLLSQGLNSLDQIVVSLRLEQLRHEAILDAIEITEEEIEEAYYEWFVVPAREAAETTAPTTVPTEAPTETSADATSDTGDEEDESEATEEETTAPESTESDVPDLEEVRDDLEAYLINEMANDHAFGTLTLANLRAEAGFTFFSDYFQYRYMEHLDLSGVDTGDLASGETLDANDFDDGAVAAIEDEALTADELFNLAVYRNVLILGNDGSTPLLIYIDFQLLEENFEGDRDQVRSNINQMKISFSRDFYPMMAQQGLHTDQEIFDHFMRLHLQELAFDDTFGDVDAETLEELYNDYMPPREVRHILVDDEDEAADIIAQLQEVDEDDLEDLFAELALEHSSCPSSASGGSLGVLSIPSGMVIEFEEAAFDLEVGEFSPEPVETEFGYHVILVPMVEDGLTGERLRSHLRTQYLQQLRMNPANLASVLIDLRTENNLAFHDDVLQAQYDLIVERNNERLENE